MFRFLVLFRLLRVVLVGTFSSSQSSLFRLSRYYPPVPYVYTHLCIIVQFFFLPYSLYVTYLSICHSLYVLEFTWFVPPLSFETLLWMSVSAEDAGIEN
jgi:hypothetical protein